MSARSSDLKIDEATGSLENRFLKITLDPARGTIASIVDKQSNRELVDRQSKYGFGQYLFEQFTGDDVRNYIKAYGKWSPAALCKQRVPPATQLPRVAASPENFSLSVANDGIAATATLTAKPSPAIDHTISLKITLYRDTQYADLEWSITGKRPDLRPEAGWLCLPVNAANPEFRLSRMLGVVNPATDICRNSNFDVFCLDAGLTVQGKDDAGLGICPVNAPLVSLGTPGLMRFSGAWSPREPVVFVNLFNNVWGCNFRQWIDGAWSSRVRIWPTRGHDVEKNLMTPGREAQVACLSALVDAPAGTLPPEQAGLTLSRQGVMVTAFGTNPDGTGTLLRVWEQAGNSGELTVIIPANFKTATPVNLRGENTGKPLAIHSGKLKFNLGAYAPASFVLE